MSKPTTKYFVDNESQTTDQKELSVRQILVNSGNDPETHYLVEIKGDHQVDHKNLDEQIHIHENEKFAAIFTGTTPVS